MNDYYAILGVSRNATATEIRDAYLKLARNTHPDTVKDREARKSAEQAFQSVTAAYDTLSKERSRRDYTAKLPALDEQQAPQAASRTMPPVVQGPPLANRDPKAGFGPVPSGGPAQSPDSTGRVTFDVLAQGIEAYKKQDYHTAVQLLKQAVAQAPGNAKAHAVLSLTMAKNPKWLREALQHMEAASKLEPKNVSYIVEVALMLQSQGLKLRAKRALETAIALNPEHSDIARGLKEISLAPPEGETPTPPTADTPRGFLDRLRKR